MGLLMNSIVDIFQIFYKKHIFLFIFYIVFNHWKLFFMPTPEFFCFFEKGCLVLSSSFHQGHTCSRKGPFLGNHEPGSSLRPLSSIRIWTRKLQWGEKMSLKLSHSYPLMWEEICRWQLEAFFTLQIVLKSRLLLFFRLVHVLSRQKAGGSASGFGKVVWKKIETRYIIK